MTSSPNLDQMTPEQLRALAAQLLSKVDTMGRESRRDKTVIEQLSHECIFRPIVTAHSV
jgi:transposase